MAQAIRPLIETQYANQMQAFADSPWFQRLEQGQASSQEYDTFIFNLCQTHLKSPQILAFLSQPARRTGAGSGGHLPPRSALSAGDGGGV